MKKVFLLSVAVFAAVLGGGAAYTWNQATRLPTWYTPSATTLSEVGSANELLSSKVTQPEPGASLTLTLSEQEVNQVVLGAIAQQPETAQFLKASKGINTSLENEQIESGMVVNLSDIPADALPPQGQEALAQLTQKFPILANRDIYVGIKGSPRIEEGRLVLDDNTMVTIGRFQLPLSELANQLGLPKAQIEAQLDQALAQNGINLQDIQIEKGQVVIHGIAQ
ncbi:MAG TPA: hypothetical protein V6D07_14790 [Trichocoleus sp.]